MIVLLKEKYELSFFLDVLFSGCFAVPRLGWAECPTPLFYINSDSGHCGKQKPNNAMKTTIFSKTMGKNFNTDSFDKGKAFENYIQNVIFTEDTYDQLERTPDIDQNAIRFTTSTLNPDFYYKCRRTQKKFYVEAKFRSHFFTGDILTLFNNQEQFDRFKEIDKPETPIFMAIGCGGTATEPSTISIVPFSEITNLTINKLEVDKHLIDKGTYNYEKLWKLIVSNEKAEPIREEKQTEQPTEFKSTKKKISRKITWLILSTFFLLALVFSIPQIKTLFSGTTPTNIVVKPKVTEVKVPVVVVVPQPVVVKTDPIVAPADIQSTVDMLNSSLTGDWSGKFGSDNLLIHLDEIGLNFSVTGYNEVGENRRDLNGRVEYNGNSHFTIILDEPGDDPNDGSFRIKYIEGGAVLNGVWTAPDGNGKVGFTLKK